MLTLLIVLQVVLSIILIVIIILQKGKGAEMGVSFGAGASDTLFGTSGGISFLAKLTWAIAFLFMVNSFSISYIVYNAQNISIIQKTQKTHEVHTTPAPIKK